MHSTAETAQRPQSVQLQASKVSSTMAMRHSVAVVKMSPGRHLSQSTSTPVWTRKVSCTLASKLTNCHPVDILLPCIGHSRRQYVRQHFCRQFGRAIRHECCRQRRTGNWLRIFGMASPSLWHHRGQLWLFRIIMAYYEMYRKAEVSTLINVSATPLPNWRRNCSLHEAHSLFVPAL